MELTQSTLEKTFTVKHKGKYYYVNYLNSSGNIPMNRFEWEVIDEEYEELCVCEFQNATKKEKEQIEKNRKLYLKLIKFCIKHFDDYKPDLYLLQ